MQKFNLALSKSADYEAINDRLAEAERIFGRVTIGLNLVDLALQGKLTTADLKTANQ